MSEGDERNFIKFLRTDDDVLILSSRACSAEPDILAKLPDEEVPWGFQVWLWNVKISPPPKVYFVPEHKYYYLDPLPSEVIQFSRCRMVNGCLAQGRLWMEANGWERSDPGTIIRKGDSFTRWYNRLSNWIKRQAISNESGFYFLEGAARFVANGGKVRI